MTRLQNPGDLAGHALDVGEVHAAIGLRRSRHRDEDDLRVIEPVFDGIREAQPLGRDVAMHEILKPRLIDRDLPRLEHIHLALVIIDTNDVVPDLGKTSARNKADIAGTDDAEIHKERRNMSRLRGRPCGRKAGD